MAQVTAQTLGESLLLTRRRAGLTLGEAARRAKTSTSTLSRYEHDDGEPPSMLLARLAKAYGTTPNDLLGFGAVGRYRSRHAAALSSQAA